MRSTRRNPRLFGLGATVASLALLATACNGEDDGVATGPDEEENGEGQEVTIGLIPWEEGIAVTHLWQEILEEQGYDVTVQDLDVAPTFQGLAQGDIDLFLDAWLPDTHASYMDEYGDDIEQVGQWYDGATLHLTVPSYVDEVDSIEDLADNADLFDDEIIGIEAGAGLMQATEDQVIPDYDLEMTLVESSTAAMLTELETAIADEEPIVVTLWRPHPAYAEHDLKDLEDPEGSLGEGEGIESVARAGFGEDFPELNGWLQDFELNDEEISNLTQLVVGEYEDDPGEGARVWLSDNPEFLDRVLGEDAEGLDF